MISVFQNITQKLPQFEGVFLFFLDYNLKIFIIKIHFINKEKKMENQYIPTYRCIFCGDILIEGENYNIGMTRFRKNKLCCDNCIDILEHDFQTLAKL